MDDEKYYMYVSYTICNNLTGVFETHYYEHITRHKISRQKWKDIIDVIFDRHNPGNWSLTSIILYKERMINK